MGESPGDQAEKNKEVLGKGVRKMLKGFSVAALVVALVASTAVAEISLGTNVQLIDLNLQNAVLQAGDGAASSANLGLILDAQGSRDDIRHTTAFQGFNGAITQAAGATGMGVAAGALQNGQLAGAQYQNPTTGQQFQNMGTDLDQNVFKSGGMGSALAMQSALGIGTQLIFTPYGATANVQALGNVVFDGVGGGPGGSVTVNGGTTVGAGQTSVPW
jgi:hypothetical protein